MIQKSGGDVVSSSESFGFVSRTIYHFFLLMIQR